MIGLSIVSCLELKVDVTSQAFQQPAKGRLVDRMTALMRVLVAFDVPVVIPCVGAVGTELTDSQASMQCWWSSRWACQPQPRQLGRPSAAPCSWTPPCLPQSPGRVALSALPWWHPHRALQLPLAGGPASYPHIYPPCLLTGGLVSRPRPRPPAGGHRPPPAMLDRVDHMALM